MRVLFATAIVLVGCSKENPDYCPAHPEDPRCGGMGSNDGGIDAEIDADPTIDARLDFGAGDYAVHVAGPPAMATISFNPTATINTDTSNLCLGAQPTGWTSAGQPASCFVYANNVVIQDGLSVSGSRPLVLLGANSVNVSGLLDAASSVTTGKVGPGSPFSGCAAGTPPTTNTSLGGGGAGGSFITKGGDGGNGSSSTTRGVAGAQDQLAPMLLRAGCDGQPGAQGSMNFPGAKGHGGGAVYLLAGNTITLDATAIINVSGSGGGVAQKDSGGGGGGSGGMLVLYAPTITASGKMLANGGSGSSGSANGSGMIGNDPDPNAPDAPAPGPTGSGGAGGQGYGGGNAAAPGNSSTSAGGGAGGGGSGFIQSNVVLSGVTASPTPIVGP